ncbi:MAG: hypothetical protein K6E36_10120 [Oscillospiraceae bacterium]|nr:hypothetical protein [Oscillospiraceae bacterium]
MDLAANIGRPSLLHDLETHLRDGVLPADYQLPAQPASVPQGMDGETLRCACTDIVRAVHRPAWLRLRFNAAERRLKRLARSVPAEAGFPVLRDAFLKRGKRLDAAAAGDFVMQCLNGTEAEAVRYALRLVTLLERPRAFMEQSVPLWKWHLIAHDAAVLGKHPFFAQDAAEAAAYISEHSDDCFERNESADV